MNTVLRSPEAQHENERADGHPAGHPQAGGWAAGLFNTRAIGFVMGWELDEPGAAEAEAAIRPALP